MVNFGASPTTSVGARSRRGRETDNLSLYQAIARSLALGATPRTSVADARTRHLRIWNEAGRRGGSGDLGLYQALAEAARLCSR